MSEPTQLYYLFHYAIDGFLNFGRGVPSPVSHGLGMRHLFRGVEREPGTKAVRHFLTFLKASVRIWVEMGDHFHRGLLRLPSTLGLSSTELMLPSALINPAQVYIYMQVYKKEH